MIKVTKSHKRESINKNDAILKANSLIFRQKEIEMNKNRLEKEFRETIKPYHRDAQSITELYNQSKDIKWNFEHIQNSYVIDNGLEILSFNYTDKKYFYRININVVDFHVNGQDNISRLLDASNWNASLRVFRYTNL